jgi:hypothetical protein
MSSCGGLAEDPANPLFNPIDADDPNAATPTYEHLKQGLVRVTLGLRPTWMGAARRPVDLVDRRRRRI